MADLDPTKHAINIGSGRSRLPVAAAFATSVTTPLAALSQLKLGPGYTTTQKNALALGAGGEGTVVYDTTLNKLCLWTGAAWETVTSA